MLYQQRITYGLTRAGDAKALFMEPCEISLLDKDVPFSWQRSFNVAGFDVYFTVSGSRNSKAEMQLALAITIAGITKSVAILHRDFEMPIKNYCMQTMPLGAEEIGFVLWLLPNPVPPALVFFKSHHELLHASIGNAVTAKEIVMPPVAAVPAQETVKPVAAQEPVKPPEDPNEPKP